MPSLPPPLIRHAFVASLLLLGVAFARSDWPPHFESTLIVLATASAVVFCILYAALSHGAWLRTKYGRHLMVLTGGLAALGAHHLCYRLFGPWDWGWLGDHRDHRELVYLALAWQLINRIILLVASHVNGERRRKAELMRPVSHDRHESAAEEIEQVRRTVHPE